MLAALAVNAVFAARGKAASYSPPGGGSSTPCLVIKDSSDRQFGGTFGRPVMQGEVFKVRRSEVASPAKGGTFTFADDGTLTILSDPESKDAERLVWDCTAS